MATSKLEEIRVELEKLKKAKVEAIEAEDFETAALLKRRQKVLEGALEEVLESQGEHQATSPVPNSSDGRPDPPSGGPAGARGSGDVHTQRHPDSKPGGNSFAELPSSMRLLPEEHDFQSRSRKAMTGRRVTDDRSNGVPVWAYRETQKKGLQAVRTERPSDLEYAFRGLVQAEKWEEGADFQSTCLVQAPREQVFEKFWELAVAAAETPSPISGPKSDADPDPSPEPGFSWIVVCGDDDDDDEQGQTGHRRAHQKAHLAWIERFQVQKSQDGAEVVCSVTAAGRSSREKQTGEEEEEEEEKEEVETHAKVEAGAGADADAEACFGEKGLKEVKQLRLKQLLEALEDPLYKCKACWHFLTHPGNTTLVRHVLREFRQLKCFAEVDALSVASRSAEVQGERLRAEFEAARSFGKAMLMNNGQQPQQLLLRQGGNGTAEGKNQVVAVGQSAPSVLPLQREHRDGALRELYSASFLVPGPVGEVFSKLLSADTLLKTRPSLGECNDAVLVLEPSRRLLLRGSDGLVQLCSLRSHPDNRHLIVLVIAHVAGDTQEDSLRVQSVETVLNAPAWRYVEEWKCVPALVAEQQQQQQQQKEDMTTTTTTTTTTTATARPTPSTLTEVTRIIRDFQQLDIWEETDVAASVAAAADEENRSLVSTFALQYGRAVAGPAPAYAISRRAPEAMRKMPELLDMAAANNVMEVREMLEVAGADPNYIHVREDTWTISDSALVFYEEVTPLIVAAETGACDVLKVLFNHPQIDVNLCCCAFNDLEIYNYYTAYDMTLSRNHPHAAALLRARGVLPAQSDAIFKPPFDRVLGRPMREQLLGSQDNEQRGQTPDFEALVSGVDSSLRAQLRELADALTATKGQPLSRRAKLFKSLLAEWHPDRHGAFDSSTIDSDEGAGGDNAVAGGAPAKGKQTVPQGKSSATKIFQWLQLVKTWYLGEFEGGPGEMDREGKPEITR